MRHEGSDRREFFRINDTVVINYKVLQNSELGLVARSIEDTLDSAGSNHKAQLRVIENTLGYLIDQINQHDRQIARALRMLDEKITLVAQSIQQTYHPVSPEDMTEANLSGGGIAFMVEEPVDAHDSVEINLQLLPSGSMIHALAKVISCDRLDGAETDKPYHLRMAFTHMDEQDRNLLIRHTLKRQAQALRTGELGELMSLREF